MTETATPYDPAFFQGQERTSLTSAKVVLSRLLVFVRPQRLLDVGCGVGPWLRAAADLGIPEVLGIDGDYIDRNALLVDPACFVAADLAHETITAILGARAERPFDLLLCVEVAEHLPIDRAPSLVAEMTSLADMILFSAAVPFQFGTNHVNEQWPEFWSILFRANGFVCFDCLRDDIWSAEGVDWWYSQNCLVFAREGSAAAQALPATSRSIGRGLSRVHPENFLINLLALPRRYRLQAAGEEQLDYRSLVAADNAQQTTLPVLSAPARAAAQLASDRVGVFPMTRTETYNPEQEISDLSRTLGQTGAYLQAANEAEAAGRVELEAATRRVQELEERVRAEATARMLAETRLRDRIAAEAERQHQDLNTAGDRDAGAERPDRRTLDEEAATLSARAAELEQREALIDARSAEIDRVRSSRAWRGMQRARHLLRRLPPPPAPPAPAPTAPATSETAFPPGEREVAEKTPIKKWDRILGEVNWWTLAAAVTRLKRLEVFDPDDYLRRNPDVQAAGLEPHAHFIQSGALEDRGRTDPEDLARLLGSLALFEHAVRSLPQEATSSADLASLVTEVGPIGIFVSSEGNMFMNDLAIDLAGDLRFAGATVDVLDERTDIDRRPAVCIFVAPHEFFTLGTGSRWIRDDVLSEGFVFGTEQLQTTWFNTALPFTLLARGIFDICAQTADLFARTDMAALHVLPGAQLRPHTLNEVDRRHPLFAVLPADAMSEFDPSTPFKARPIDVSFFGASSPRRDQFFARNAEFFAEYEAFNYCRRPGRGPIRAESEDGTLSRIAAHVCGHSKITLNIHREEFGYFEWHRMVRLGMCAGSLVVSDPCLPHPSFIANEHFLQENARNIPNLLEWLLRTDDGAREAERIRGNVDRLITGQYNATRNAERILRFLAQHRAHER